MRSRLMKKNNFSKKISIVKNNGEFENFDKEKLRSSLLKAGASMTVASDIIKNIEEKLTEGITSSEIYKIAFRMVRKKEKATALRYSIKRSILTLGPTGFPFEKFMERIFQIKGYQTKVGQTLMGRCVEHEVDLMAYNKDELALMEIKFHNTLNIKTDTKVALYVKARYDDMKENFIDLKGGERRKPTRCILITNTKFTQSAEQYAVCNGLDLISWDYPQKGNLYDLINETDLIPITALSTLNKTQKDQLIQENFICCDQIRDRKGILDKIGLNKDKINKVLEEIKLLEEKQNLN